MYSGRCLVSSKINDIYCPNIEITPNKIEAINSPNPIIVP